MIKKAETRAQTQFYGYFCPSLSTDFFSKFTKSAKFTGEKEKSKKSIAHWKQYRIIINIR